MTVARQIASVAVGLSVAAGAALADEPTFHEDQPTLSRAAMQAVVEEADGMSDEVQSATHGIVSGFMAAGEFATDMYA